MSVGEDHQHNDRRGQARGSLAMLDRRHTFILGLVVGAALLQLGRWLGGPPSVPSSVAAAPRAAAVVPSADERTPPPATPAAVVSAPAETPTTPVPAYFALAPIAQAAAPQLSYAVPAPPLVRREGAIKRNQFLATILTEAGVTLANQDEMFRAFRKKFDFRYARPGQKYVLQVDPQKKHVVSFEFRAAVDEVYRASRTKDGTLKAERIEVPLEREVVQVTGRIDKSLWDAFVDAGESEALSMELADAFKFDIDFFHDTRKGDTFKLFVEKFSNDQGELVRYGRIYAAEYVGAPRSPVGRKRLFWFKGRKTKGYYDEKGKAAQRAFLRSPVKFTRISSPFGYRRHPILRKRHFHGGVDYAAPRGTPVQAVAAGKVIFAARKGPNGKMVKIKHNGGYVSYYLHLSRIMVRKGQGVGQSTIIGKVGSTGRSTGPHLDFRLKKKGKYINPRKHVAPRTKQVARKDRDAYFRTIKPWVAKLDA